MLKKLFFFLLMIGWTLAAFAQTRTPRLGILPFSGGTGGDDETIATLFSTEKQESVSVNFNASLSSNGSGAYFFEQSEFKGGFDTWLKLRISGDLGSSVSYFTEIGVALLYAEREYLGRWPIKIGSQETTDVYSYPLGYFPYDYQSSWGGFVFPLTGLNAGGPTGWPDTTSIGFNLLYEIVGTSLNNILLWRIGRNKHEVAGIVDESSLVLNKAAQPFFSADLQINPLKWLYLYSLTGILEYYDSNGIQTSASTFQNAFSLSILSVHYRQYIKIDVGSSVIWPKRFELGYLFPLTFPLLYQNNTGDFDNLTLFGNIKLQYPGLGFLWSSLFIDEINFEKDFFHLDREMYAFQTGLRFLIPFIPFASLTASYTKIEPYCYTHQKVKVPWYDKPMEQAYTNHGYGLGYYLPPNSDELKIVFDTMPTFETAFSVQFQFIHHGAEYGDYMVDGSSYVSELKENDRSSKSALRKDFLNDGAYQSFIIFKTGVKHSLKNFPLEFSFNTGIVFSYWKYNGNVLDNDQYPSRTGIITEIGVIIRY
jgi:hypothetical protein